MSDRSSFREALVDLIETTYPEPADHPSIERWMAYHRGELAPAEEERCAEHLVRCRDCFDLVQAVDAFGGEEEPTAGEEVASAALWRLLGQRLARARAAARPPGHRWRPRAIQALAASLLLALGGSAAWNVQQQRALERLRTPQPNASILYFAGRERSTGTEQVLRRDQPYMFVFNPTEELSSYRLTIREAGSSHEVDSYDLRPDEDSSLTFYLPAERLRPGHYRFAISERSGRSAGGPEEYLVHVVESRRGE